MMTSPFPRLDASVLVGHLPHRVFVKDRNSVYIFCNAHYARDLGVDPGEVAGRNDFAFYPRDLAGKYRADDVTVMLTGTPMELEEEYTVGGERRWVHTMKVPYRDESGHVVGVLGVFEDITSRREAEERARKVQRLYTVLSAMNELIVREHDRQAILAGACRIAVELGGFALAWVGLIDPDTGRLAPAAYAGAAEVPEPLRTILDDDRPACAYMDSLAAGRCAFCDEIAECERSGSACAAARACGYRATASFPLMVSGRFTGVFTLFSTERDVFDAEELGLLDELARDVSFGLENSEREAERQRVLDELSASEARFHELAETIEEVFWVTDTAKQTMLYVSPGYDRIWGRSRDRLYESALHWLDAVHPEDRERVREAALNRQATGQYDETYRIVRPDGAVRWVQDRAFPVRGGNGTVERIVGSARDITEQRAIEEQFRQAQKLDAIGRLAGGVAHDFNNLLTVILGYAEIMRDELAPPLLESCGEVIAAAQRARSLTRQLLAFSRRQALQLEPLDLNEVLHRAETMLRRLIGEHVEIVVRRGETLGTVRADRGQIEQVLLNLAVNARDAMPAGGRLVIETRNEEIESPVHHEGIQMPPGSYVSITVADTGVGMDADTQARLFEPFFTTKAPGKGTGLGLSTVYGIVKQLEGHIWVHSESGHGSTFRVYFRRTDDAPVSVRTEASVGTLRGDGVRVLVVEDEQALRAVAERMLVRQGYEVLCARTAEEALDLARESTVRFDVLVTDVVLPGMSGPTLAAHLTDARPGLKVVYVSGYIPDSIAPLSGLDVRTVLQKPFTADALLRRIHDVLGDRAAGSSGDAPSGAGSHPRDN